MDFKKMNIMLTDLKSVKTQLCPEDPDSLHEAVLNDMDPFTRTKTQINDILRPLSKEVDRLGELRAAAPDGRDRNTIALFSENSKNLLQAGNLWNQLKTIVQKDEQKKLVDEKTTNDRKKLVTILGNEIKDISNRNNHVHEKREATSVTAMTKREQKNPRRARRQRENREEKKSIEDDIDLQVRDVQVSVEDQKFFDEVEEEKRNQDRMMDQILTGLIELEDVAKSIKIEIVASTELTQEITDETEKLNEKFKGSNQRLKEILEETGGLSRWCPILICIVLLIALVGYLINIL